MAEPFLGQIMQAGWGFASQGFALCNGQLMPISQNTALFALLGTTYGGDGIQTFGLPDLRGRVPLHMGQGNGLSNRVIGEISGTENVSLLATQLPMHTHSAMGSSADANKSGPGGNTWANEGTGSINLYANSAPDSPMNPQAIGTAGGNQPHNNMRPFLVNSFQIALEGIFPSRN